MSENNILVSVIIPTKNRSEYAINCICSILNFEYNNFELVVVDNSDDDLLQNWIYSKISDSRLKYIRENDFLTVVENFQIGIDNANGEYVCTIGDDDGLNPEIIELVEWAKKNNIDAVTPKFIADYIWPDLNHEKNNSVRGGSLKIKKFSQRIVFLNVEKGLNQLSSTCGMDLADSFYIPKIYYGIIKNDVLKKAKNEIGTNFPGVSPDLSGAIVASAYINKYCVIDYPIFIAGSSIKSTAGSSNLKKHHGSLNDQKHISRDAIASWPKQIPNIFSVETVWSQSAYMSLKAIRRDDLVANYNFPRIYASLLMFNRSYYKYVITSFLFTFQKSIVLNLFKVLIEYIYLIFIRAKYLMINLRNKFFGNAILYSEIHNIDQANLKLSEYLKRNNFSLNKILHND
jgi:glycosyltransferase involved in cell wall biosynthesis